MDQAERDELIEKFINGVFEGRIQPAGFASDCAPAELFYLPDDQLKAWGVPLPLEEM